MMVRKYMLDHQLVVILLLTILVVILVKQRIVRLFLMIGIIDVKLVVMEIVQENGQKCVKEVKNGKSWLLASYAWILGNYR